MWGIGDFTGVTSIKNVAVEIGSWAKARAELAHQNMPIWGQLAVAEQNRREHQERKEREERRRKQEEEAREKEQAREKAEKERAAVEAREKAQWPAIRRVS